MRAHRYFFTLFLLAASVAFAQPKLETITDGPYVFHTPVGVEARWICNGALHTTLMSNASVLKAPCGTVSGFALDDNNLAIAPDTLPAPTRWAAVSDTHGQNTLLLSLLRAQGIVDAAGRWAWGRGVLVVVGDVFDRGDTQTESLWLVYRLSSEAREAGGRVEMRLGNHETMVLANDLRYLHPKYPLVATALNTPFPQLFGDDTELGKWLRARATMLKLGDTLFVHGGLHPDFIAKWPTLDALNNKMRKHLGEPRAARNMNAEASWLFGRDGPVWYRGYFVAPRASLAQVDKQLAHFGVRRIVVGHTTRHEVTSLYGGRVVAIDAGLKEGTRGELLIWENKQLSRGLLSGKRIPLAAGKDDGSRELKDEDEDDH